MTIRHFLTTQDFSRAELDSLLVLAKQYKREKFGDALKGRAIALVFFNSSMRTRSSFEIGAWQLGESRLRYAWLRRISPCPFERLPLGVGS